MAHSPAGSERRAPGTGCAGLTVRVARPEDAELLGGLDRAAWSTLHEVVPQPTPPYPPYFDERRPPGEHLVAELDGRVVGCIRLVRPTPLASHAHVRQIQGFVVAAAARGRGVGRALLDAAVAEARRLGARRVTLRVLGHNTPARRLYEAAGFVVEGVLPEEFCLNGEYVDDVLMGRRT